MESSTTKYRTCPLCEAMCGLEIEIQDNKAISIKGDQKDPFSKGHICPKALGLKDLHEDTDRLKQPIKKVNGEWKKISWEAAFDEVASKLRNFQIKYGPNSIGYYAGNPAAHNTGTLLTSPDFIRALKTKNRFSATSVDQLPHHLAAQFMFGHPLLMPIPDIRRTDYWLILGGNPLVSNGSIMTAPDCGGIIRDIKNRGGKVVVIDPRRTETARKASEHHFIRPKSDVFLLMAMVKYIFDHDKVNLRHVADLIDQSQLDEIRKAVEPYTINLAADKTGISHTAITEIFNDFLSADKAVCYGRMGVSVTTFGSICQWAVNLINILTGNFDRAGGHMFTTPAFEVINKRSRGKIKFNRWQSRVRGLPEFGGEIPSVTLAEEIITPGEGQIKCMVTNCGNPVLSTPNGRQVGKAFESLEYMVCIDIYINETTKYADIILPPATGLEVPHYDTTFNLFAISNTAKYSDPMVNKEENTKYDYEIFQALTKRLIHHDLPKDETARANILYKLQMNPKQMISFGLKKGGQVTMDTLEKHPNGIDLGALKPCIHDRMMTMEGKIDLIPEIYLNDLDRLKKEIDNSNSTDLLLIGRRHLRSNNSWMHNSQRLVKGRDRCTALIHPDTAAAHHISDGSDITLKSRVGQITVPAEVSDEIMPNVIAIPHGWGHTSDEIEMSIASAHAGQSCNDLTDELLIDELTGNAAVNGVPVEIVN